MSFRFPGLGKKSTNTILCDLEKKQVDFDVERLEDRTLLAVIIAAAGATGEESLSLEINDQIVRTWNNVGGDFDGGQFQSLTYDVDGVNANDIRLIFNNDGNAADGSDRNLRIDNIRVDGHTIEAEDGNVFSVGSYDTASGCGGGFKQSEFIHCGPGSLDFEAYNSVIRVRAAGQTGEEQMQLLIDGAVVQTFNGIGGDYFGGSFETFVYEADEYISADRVRVVFPNDGVSATGEDINLRVDHIEIDGRVFESEDASVLSQGSWRESDGCAAGFKQSEFLHCDGGFFQYSESGDTGGGGSTIEVLADGTTNDEIIELSINGTVVATYSDLSADLVYQANADVEVDDVRIAFVNDGETNGVDRNVIIDGIILDGVKFETEDQTTYSEGSYRSSDGCDPGFKSSDTLHCNGFVQFQVANRNAGAIQLETSNYSFDEDAGTATVTILRNNGSEGIVSIDYQTVAASAVAGVDFQSQSGRVVFADGEASRTVSIDLIDNSQEDGDRAFNFTIDSVEGGADLLVPRTATVTIVDNESDGGGLGGFNLVANSFDGTTGINLNGDAVLNNGELQLTSTGADEVGTAFYGQAIEFDANTSFETSFQFRIDGGQGTGGAYGMTFILQNDAGGSDALGFGRGGLGYAALDNSVAIEFDTFQNLFDSNANHVSILTNGDVEGDLGTAVSPIDLNGGSLVNAWITYDGLSNELSVYVSATTTRPNSALLTRSVDLAGIGDRAFFGFSASTGGLTNRHAVTQWTFESSTLLEAQSVEFTGVTVASGFRQPTSIDWSNDGRNLYIAEQGGQVFVMRDGVLQSTPTLDFRDRVNGTRDRGLLDIAIHPDLENNPYIYLLYTYDPPEVNNFTGLAGPDGNGNRAARLTRVELNAATNYTTIIPNSEVVILGTNSTWDNFNGFVNSTSDFNEPPAGILPDGTNLVDFLAADSSSHTIGSVEFGPDGSLFVSNGDGTSFNRVDPRTVRVQDIDNLSGKIIRIDPITGEGLADNPFYNGDPDANRSKVYQYGLRNPFRFTVSDSGQVFVGDVGWTTWEEINAAGAGANFGWPYYEGGANGVSQQTNGYRDLDEAQAFFASGQSVEAPFLALSHAGDGINAIVAGDIYTGTAYPSNYQGDLLLNDLGQGIVRNVSFDSNGNITDVSTFATGANVVVQMKNGPDGFMYYVDLDDGLVGRWEINTTGASRQESPATVTGSDGKLDDDTLPGVVLKRRSLSISLDESAGPLTINLEDRVIATDDGLISIPESVRKIVARGGQATSDAIHLVGTESDESVQIKPGKLRLRGDGILISATGFESVNVHGAGGNDQATLTGSRGSDRFESDPVQAVLNGESFSFSVSDFDNVTAVAVRGGQDEAVFYDSDGDDLLTASSRELELAGDGYQNIAQGFTQTVAYSVGGLDRAIWNDRFAGSDLQIGEQYGALIGRSIAHELNGTWRLFVTSSDENVFLSNI